MTPSRGRVLILCTHDCARSQMNAFRRIRDHISAQLRGWLKESQR
jgi:hypothetical protein